MYSFFSNIPLHNSIYSSKTKTLKLIDYFKKNPFLDPMLLDPFLRVIISRNSEAAGSSRQA